VSNAASEEKSPTDVECLSRLHLALKQPYMPPYKYEAI
jgi:hypothetical protein